MAEYLQNYNDKYAAISFSVEVFSDVIIYLDEGMEITSFNIIKKKG